jgi:hypothetical protein
MRQNWLWENVAQFYQALMLFILGVAALVSTVQWLHNPLARSIDPDEIVWVLDAAAFSWYITGDIQEFKLTKTLTELKWVEQEYRVIDQPQMGKYILGMALTFRGLEPWMSPQKQELYEQFAYGSFSPDLKEKIDPEILASINYLRQVSTYFSLAAFFLVGWLVYKETHQTWTGILIFILLTQNETIRLYYRLAIVNSYSFLAQAIAAGLLVTGLRIVSKAGYADVTKSWKQLLVFGAAAGFFVAVASSIKLDGVFLVLVPYMFLLLLGISSLIRPRFDVLLGRYVVWLIGFTFSGLISFFLIEPELWNQPIQHTHLLISSRLAQQQRFLVHLEDLSVLEVMERWVQYVFKLAPVGQLLLVVVITICLLKIFSAFEKILREGLEQIDAYELLQKSALWLVVISVWFGSLYCSRVGIDRYLIPAVVAFYTAVLVLAAQLRTAKT